MTGTYISRNDIINIFRQIVINYPESECCTGLDTFAVIDSPEEWNLPNHGKIYQDYLDGTFYSKYWVGQGSPSGNVCAKFGKLFVNQTEFKASSDCGITKLTDQWNITICIQKQCPKCGKKNPTNSDTIKKLRQIALNVWSELKKYKLFINYEDDQLYWMTDDMADVYDICEGYTMGEHDCGLNICDCIVEPEIEFYPIIKGLMTEGVGMGFTFHLQGCHVPTVEMNYKPKRQDPIHLAKAICSTC